MNGLVRMYLFGDVDEVAVRPLVVTLSELTAEDGAEIYICSGGGDCDSGYALIDAIRTCPARVVTIALGGVGSIAMDILVAGDYRKAMPLTTGMCHPADKRTSRRGRKELQLEDQRGWKLYLDRTRFKDVDHLRRVLFNGRDVYLSANEMLDCGLIDEIVRIK